MNKDRKLVPIKNNPGIYKILRWDKDAQDWKDSGKFLSTRRIIKDGQSKREKAVFVNIQDAKDYRAGKLEKSTVGSSVHRQIIYQENEIFTFEKLIQEWKSFHFLRLENATKQLYERKLPYLDLLKNLEVEKIDASSVDKLIGFWVNECSHAHERQSFHKELKLLSVILHFYQSRKNRAYLLPIQNEHFDAAILKRKASNDVQALSETDLARFLQGLKIQKNPIYYPLALTQFCLSLRISEACGLRWEDLDFEKGQVKIEQTISWNDRTWEATIKRYPKNGAVRFLALPELLVDALQQWKMKADIKVPLIFHNEGKLLNRKSIATAYNRTLKQLGITYVSGTHMMRRTSATLANEATGDFYAVSRVLDHSSPEITKRYVKDLTSQKRKVAEALNGVLQPYFSGVKSMGSSQLDSNTFEIS